MDSSYPAKYDPSLNVYRDTEKKKNKAGKEAAKIAGASDEAKLAWTNVAQPVIILI